MVADRKDETPGRRRKAPETGSGGDVVDLWSLPPDAIPLDDSAFWGDDQALGRLAAVLPALGGDLDLGEAPAVDLPHDAPGPFTGRQSTAGPPFADDLLESPRAAPRRADTRHRSVADRAMSDQSVADRSVADRSVADRSVADRSVADRSAQGRAGQGRADHGRPDPADGGPRARYRLGLVGTLALLLVAYVAAVALAILESRSDLPGSDSDSVPPQGRIVTDGPVPCPMYRAPADTRAPATESRACFLVG